MFRHWCSKQTDEFRLKAFTLVELLVVIGIMAVLVSILLPSLAKARVSAQQVACSSNLRQIGMGIAMYIDSQQGWFPIRRYRQPDDIQVFNWNSHVSWASRLIQMGLLPPSPKPAFSGNSPLYCPTYSTHEAAMDAGFAPNALSHYAVDMVLTGYWNETAAPGSQQVKPFKKVSKIKNSSEVMALADGRWLFVPSTPAGYVTGSFDFWESDAVCAASNTKNNRYVPGLWMTNPTNTTSISPSSTFTGFVHSGGANFLFLDGHVEWRKAEVRTDGLAYGRILYRDFNTLP